MTRHTASLRAAILRNKQAIRYIAVNAVQDVMEAAMTPQPSVKRTGGTFIEGKIPVDEAVLINSLVSAINGNDTSAAPTSYSLVLGHYTLGDELQFRWTAPHALRIEKGYAATDSLGRVYNMPGRYFVGKNAARFSEFVNKRASEVQR